MTRETTYDVESFPNFFCVAALHDDLDHAGVFECSSRRNDVAALSDFVPTLERMVGYNNVGYDYLMVHYACWAHRNGEFRGWTGEQVAARMHELNNHIIGQDRDQRLVIWERDYIAPQLDLMKVHHMDQRVRGTSLKALQFAMRMPSIEESPVPFGTWLTPDQMEHEVAYCVHDVRSTQEFRKRSRAEIEFREALGPSWMNLSDTSIGKRFFRERLEQINPGCTKLKTVRGNILIGDVMLPWLQFRHEPFTRELHALQKTTVHASTIRTANAPGHGFGSIVHHGFRFEFGAGGLHGSVKRSRIEATDDLMIVDVDVESYYPRIAIVNRFYPLHLGEGFCDAYAELFTQRTQYAKGTPDNTMRKLGLNGVYGDSNNPHGPFFDPAYTLATTINGQMMLCMLAEPIMDLPGARMIQANTDGLTVLLPRQHEGAFRDICAWWEWGTGLKLGRTDYRRMFVRDVNNYIADPVDRKKPPKRIGAYEYELDWWQDPSALCVPRAAEAAILHGEDPEVFLRRRLVEDPWDFMLRTKVPRSSRLFWGNLPAPTVGQRERMLDTPLDWECPVSGSVSAQRVTRYYVSTGGWPLTKVMPPLRENGDERRFDVEKGCTVQICNRFDGRPPADVALDWYVKEARKLIIR